MGILQRVPTMPHPSRWRLMQTLWWRSFIRRLSPLTTRRY